MYAIIQGQKQWLVEAIILLQLLNKSHILLLLKLYLINPQKNMAQNPRRFWKTEFGMKVQRSIWLRILSGTDVAVCE